MSDTEPSATARAAPLQRFLRSARDSRDFFALGIASLLAAYMLLSLALALSPSAQLALMQRFHLRSESFALWAAAQPSAWMYNFENRALVSPRPLSAAELEAPPDGLRWEYVNHQVARRMTFFDGRARFLSGTTGQYFYLESRYRNARVRSAYRVIVVDAPGPEARAAHLERMELP